MEGGWRRELWSCQDYLKVLGKVGPGLDHGPAGVGAGVCVLWQKTICVLEDAWEVIAVGD